MKINQVNFPHPVLSSSSDDYIERCEFSAKIDIEDGEGENFAFSAKYNLKCVALEVLIKQKKAKAILVIKSVPTLYLGLRNLSKRKSGFTIPASCLAGKVIMTPQIVITDDVENFAGYSELNNKYFDGASFNLSKGDIVAIGDDEVFYIDDTELSGNLSSLFPIVLSKEQEDPVNPVFEENRIIIYVNPETYKQYAAMSKGDCGVETNITALIINPVIVEAIEQIREEHDGDTDENFNKWEYAFLNRANNIGMDLFDKGVSSCMLANKLSGGSISTALSEIERIFEEEDE